ncbi:MAG TPA: prolyl oligopeptidase family serine peptidase, partial [Gemmataceae bacterium]|nr:prolyl oligopeptidase family serine peptidase [Gemmataceae bacterium]
VRGTSETGANVDPPDEDDEPDWLQEMVEGGAWRVEGEQTGGAGGQTKQDDVKKDAKQDQAKKDVVKDEKKDAKVDQIKKDDVKKDAKVDQTKKDDVKKDAKVDQTKKDDVKKDAKAAEAKKEAVKEAPKVVPPQIKFEIKVPTNAELAENLKGHLLLVHGEMDNNVHPANTMRLVDALIKANKRFDMLILPGKRHAYADYQPYFNRRMYDFFAENLLGERLSNADLFEKPTKAP